MMTDPPIPYDHMVDSAMEAQRQEERRSEAYRFACEVRHIARLTPAQRESYLDGVASRRSKEAAQELRVAAAAILWESGR